MICLFDTWNMRSSTDKLHLYEFGYLSEKSHWQWFLPAADGDDWTMNDAGDDFSHLNHDESVFSLEGPFEFIYIYL